MKVLFPNLYVDYKPLGYILNHTHHFPPFLDYQVSVQISKQLNLEI